MAGDKVEVLLVGPPKPTIVNCLAAFTLHRLGEAKDRDALLKEVGGRVRAIASSVTSEGGTGPTARCARTRASAHAVAVPCPVMVTPRV